MADFNFNFNVDTSPMAQGLHHVGNQVSTVTGAVVEMKNAVLVAEKNAADAICSNVNRGFYTLIRSQISQKIAKLKSDVDSKFMEMMQQSASLRAFRNRMEMDYHMIASRYTKLFNSLNKSLRVRIFELDKYPTRLVTQTSSLLTNRMKNMVATVPINQSESIIFCQRIAASKTRFSGTRLLSGIKRFIADSNSQKALIHRILLEKRLEANGKLMLPFLITESISADLKQPQTRIITSLGSDKKLNELLEQKIVSEVYEKSEEIKWDQPKQEVRNLIDLDVRRSLANGDISDRVKKEMLRLLDESDFITVI